MTILLPMAGRGERYSKRGYTMPKPLIPVNGTPMVIKAVNDLPKADKHVFVLLEEHIQRFGIDRSIRRYLPHALFVPLKEVTEGQASTCLTGLEKIHEDEELLIGACDNGIIFEKRAWLDSKKDADVLVFTFRNNSTVVEKPQQFGWVKVNERNEAVYVSVKKPLSNNPVNDHAVIGTFWFNKAAYFRKAAEAMIRQNRRVNNEYYVDECINDAVRMGLRVRVFEALKYISWGTPDDYETFNYWNSFFNQVK
ncbi:MAG TPA: sugar phosphate nucleotidyltransferase [Chitinophagales bacterium]|nr:sugar phosphate nucleotidyltransferase [Chitinophagales bacterium]